LGVFRHRHFDAQGQAGRQRVENFNDRHRALAQEAPLVRTHAAKS
jgi:hypothetical protein